jgi:hypothetical protein
MSRRRFSRMPVKPPRFDSAATWPVEPTPTSQRREQAQRAARCPDQRREPVQQQPQPQPQRRDLTPEELAAVAELSRSQIVRPAQGHPQRHEWAIAKDMDQAGAPCACSDHAPCLLHNALDGRRRHVRPGQQGKGRDLYPKRTNDRTGRRPQTVPEYDG